MAEDDNVQIDWLEVGGAEGILIERSETNKIVVLEDLDFFTRLLELDVFSRERVKPERLQGGVEY